MSRERARPANGRRPRRTSSDESRRPSATVRQRAPFFTALSLALLCAACGDDARPAEETDLGYGRPDRPPRGLTPEAWGERLFVEHGCLGCHSLHGARSVGGNLSGIWAEPRSFTDGATGTVDEAYVRESIDAPNAKVVAGFDDVMPSYRQELSQAQVDALVAFLASRRR